MSLDRAAPARSAATVRSVKRRPGPMNRDAIASVLGVTAEDVAGHRPDGARGLAAGSGRA